MLAVYNLSGKTDIDYKGLGPNKNIYCKCYGLNIRYQVHMLNVKSMILSVIQAYSGFSQTSHQLLPYFQAPQCLAILR